MEATLQERAIKAATRILYRRGYDIVDDCVLDPEGEVNLVAKDGEMLVFCKVRVNERGEGFPVTGEFSRSGMEESAARWLAAHADDPELVDVPMRFDMISLLVVSDSRAMVRHHINCLG